MLILKNSASKSAQIFQTGRMKQYWMLVPENKSDKILVGVNDAESMKRLRQRFRAVGNEG